MNDRLFTAVSFIVLVAAFLLCIYPDYPSAIAFVAACTLFGVIHFMESRRIDHISQLEKRMKLHEERVDSQVKAVREKIDIMMIGKGIGR